jgi:hypothetical protein
MKRLMFVFLCLMSLNVIGCDKATSISGGNVDSVKMGIDVKEGAVASVMTGIDAKEEHAKAINHDCKYAYTASYVYLEEHPSSKLDNSTLAAHGYRASTGVTTKIFFTDSKNYIIICTGDAAWSLYQNTAKIIIANGDFSMVEASASPLSPAPEPEPAPAPPAPLPH